ncbi:MAG TPA: UDP-glucose 4-epimerase GalE [Pirellulales bacterium]
MLEFARSVSAVYSERAMVKILVTGGAGYIGSHAARFLDQAGHDVWVYDNLGLGHRAAALAGRLIEGDLHDQTRLTAALREKAIDAVMHFAAFALVGESVADPAKYYRNNVGGSLSLLEAMRAAGVAKIVFSSTTATYGAPQNMPISEDEPQQPINPYGFTKLAIERALEDYAHAYGFAYAALRYFNAAGANPHGDLGEDHSPESHLIPIVLQVALGQRERITLFGDDYPTPDGTCIRDYVHVDDLASAHALALERLTPGEGLKLNLGTGHGQSVREVIDACRRVTGRDIPEEIGPRRPGDPPELVADARRARQVLGWTPKFVELDAIVATAWRWHASHPHGYGDRAGRAALE